MNKNFSISLRDQPCWDHVGATWSSIGTTLAVFDQNKAFVRLSWVHDSVTWGYVRPAAVYVGARFGRLGAMLGLCWPI